MIDLDSNNLVLALVLVVVIALIRTLIFAGKEINSSDRFPTSKKSQGRKKDEDDSLKN